VRLYFLDCDGLSESNKALSQLFAILYSSIIERSKMALETDLQLLKQNHHSHVLQFYLLKTKLYFWNLHLLVRFNVTHN